MRSLLLLILTKGASPQRWRNLKLRVQKEQQSLGSSIPGRAMAEMSLQKELQLLPSSGVPVRSLLLLILTKSPSPPRWRSLLNLKLREGLF